MACLKSRSTIGFTAHTLRLILSIAAAMVLLTSMGFVLRSTARGAVAAEILYVDGATGTDSTTCGAAATPCATISYAIHTRGGSGDTIRVAQGVYTENLTVDYPVTLAGGYVPDGGTWAERSGESIIDGSGSPTVWGDYDGMGINTTAVISDEGEFKLWYGAQNLSRSDGIALATSPDGITWTKWGSNPVLTPTEDWEWGMGHPFVIKDGSVYKMWYSASDERIGYAWSSDGVSWTKYSNNPIMEGTPGSWDQNGVSAPTVVKVGDDDYRMWYRGRYPQQIGYATSTDGIVWTKHSAPVVTLGSSGSWDADSIWDPAVYFDGTMYHMWYGGTDGDVAQIGYASSADGVSWARSAANPILSPDAAETWREVAISAPTVWFDGSTYHMWFTGWQDGWQTPQKGYATSSDGVTWDVYDDNPVLSPGAPGHWGESVVTFVDGSDGAVLDGFTVRNGDAEYGGGIRVGEDAHAHIHSCIVMHNTALSGLGGGGIAVVRGYATISDSTVISNTAVDGAGGGIRVDNGTAIITATQIVHNSVVNQGGAGLLANWGKVSIINSIVAHNSGDQGWNGEGTLVWGDNSLVSLMNSTIVSNTGEGVMASQGKVGVTNCILMGNQNGGLHNYNSGATITSTHNVLWGNRWSYGGDIISDSTDLLQDPRFVDPANGDFDLQMGSPCIDAGAREGAPTFDIAGRPRDGAPDIGAYEWQGSRIFLPATLQNFSTSPLTTWTERFTMTIDATYSIHTFCVADTAGVEHLIQFGSCDAPDALGRAASRLAPQGGSVPLLLDDQCTTYMAGPAFPPEIYELTGDVQVTVDTVYSGMEGTVIDVAFVGVPCESSGP